MTHRLESWPGLEFEEEYNPRHIASMSYIIFFVAGAAPPPVYTPKLDFSDKRNSQYIGLTGFL